jgi:hypothetical protein
MLLAYVSGLFYVSGCVRYFFMFQVLAGFAHDHHDHLRLRGHEAVQRHHDLLIGHYLAAL